MPAPSNFNWGDIINATSYNLLEEGYAVHSVRQYYWQVVVGGILAFGMAWGIGANDVANAFATSVGAGSLSLPMACVIAAVMEFVGAVLLGGSVTSTVRKGIIQGGIFDPNKGGANNGPEMLMTGFLIALLSATIWLVLATFLALPVSTTHSIIGALIGVGLAYGGGDAVNWWPGGDGFEAKMKGVVGVILSWIISPVLSGIFAVLFFLIVRHSILRRQDPYRNGKLFIPIFYGFALTMAIFFIIYKGDGRFDLEDKLGLGRSLGIAFGAGAVFAIISAVVLVPFADKYVQRWEEREAAKLKSPEEATEIKEEEKDVGGILSKVGIHLKLDEELSEDVIRMHDVVEKFDPKTERLFTWVQIFTAAVDSFAHGANDVANAIAPFTSVYQLYWHNGVLSEPLKDSGEVFASNGNITVTKGSESESVSVSEGDPLWDHEPFCGTFNDTPYYACAENPRYPYTQVSPDEAVTFPILAENASSIGSGSCYETCYSRNAFDYDEVKQDVPIWILAMGGAGIVLGLAMWGYRIILAIGVKLTKLTPSRGFSIEIGAAITVLVASDVGLPVSTTHCQVGATMGVGLVEGKANSVNWKQFFFICVGWVFTVVFTGILSAILYLVVTYSPSNFGEQGLVSESNFALGYCPGDRMFVYDVPNDGFRGVRCSGDEL